ncbi:MAG: hypothetical protein F6K31_15060 [Symploca sp. SIO2G7]|nr:hypothetical protein [Symploca sp. SIO2G7]
MAINLLITIIGGAVATGFYVWLTRLGAASGGKAAAKELAQGILQKTADQDLFLARLESSLKLLNNRLDNIEKMIQLITDQISLKEDNEPS